MADPQEEGRRAFADALSALGGLARERGLDRVVLRRQGSLSWLLGARSHVPYTLERTWFDAVVEVRGAETGLTLVTNEIEAQRLRDTELAFLREPIPGLVLEWRVCDWWESREGLLPRDRETGSDLPYGPVRDLGAEIARLRRRLSPVQVSRLREVCRESALVASSTASRLSPGMSEHQAAGLISEGLLSRGLEPVTILVAGGDRAALHRHPLPTDAPLGDRAMLVLCGRRHGLISAVTRIVSFGAASSAVRESYRSLLEVEADFFDATLVGTTIGDAFSAGIRGYGRHGFDPLEWQRHHQGGFSGWESREFPAYATSSERIDPDSAVAWNPSAAGVKVEDTVLARPGGVEPLVRDELWPTVTVRGRQRPAILEV